MKYTLINNTTNTGFLITIKDKQFFWEYQAIIKKDNKWYKAGDKFLGKPFGIDITTSDFTCLDGHIPYERKEQ